MSLFICSKCGCIENTNLVRGSVDEQQVINSDYPNLHLSEMTSMKDGNMDSNGIRMLCSECNTGKWHGEFDKKYPTGDERRIASFSRYGMITPYDHNPAMIKRDSNAPHGYRSATDDEIMKSYTSGQESARHASAGFMDTLANKLNLDLTIIPPLDRVSLQSKEEADRAKEKAELKRTIKLAKKRKDDTSTLLKLQMRYKEL